MKKTVGILFADTMEYGPFLNWAKENGASEAIRRGNDSCSLTMKDGENSLEIIGVRCGIGKTNAASATAFCTFKSKALGII